MTTNYKNIGEKCFNHHNRSRCTITFLVIVLSIAVLDLTSQKNQCLIYVQASFGVINSHRPSILHNYKYGRHNSNQKEQSFSLDLAKRSTEQILKKQWLPTINKSDDDIYASDLVREQLEQESIKYVASLISQQMGTVNVSDIDGDSQDDDVVDADDCNIDEDDISELIKGKFRDLTCTIEGEKRLEELFIKNPSPSSISLECNNIDIIMGGVVALQSLVILGMQLGVKGTPQEQERLVQHLNEYSMASSQQLPLKTYFNSITSRQLKHQVDTTAGIQVLSALKRKRNAQGAFDLLVQMGVWEKHEDIALLRSGFPTRFTDEEIDAAIEAEKQLSETRDPDELLGLRKDLRSLKVYTIDSEYAQEIDDGLSIELVEKEDGSQRHRVWIHIADADRWGKSIMIVAVLHNFLD